ncbi:MAG: DUF2934 domain-containing protein [Candidatus Omnitrophica bacterium]|nr:DUF2934 domain-containing protein [Candidatus Omnitrophota bacterium]
MAEKKTTRKKVEKPETSAEGTGGKKSSGMCADEFYALVSKRAYELYVQSGYANGNDQGNWYSAELELRSKYKFKG